MISTIQVHEIVWTLPGVMALLLTIWMHRDVWHDWRLVTRAGWNGQARALARARVVDESLALVRLVVMTAPGIFAMTQPPHPGIGPESTVAAVLGLLLLALPSVEVARAVWAREVRTQVRRRPPMSEDAWDPTERGYH